MGKQKWEGGLILLTGYALLVPTITDNLRAPLTVVEMRFSAVRRNALVLAVSKQIFDLCKSDGSGIEKDSIYVKSDNDG